MDFLKNIPDALLTFFKDEPLVFVDVGAAGALPLAWRSLASRAVYVGFDPDARDRPVADTTGFREFHIVGKAIIDTDAAEATFHLTVSPQCSSLLRPHSEHLADYGFSDMFAVERTATVPATSLSAVIRNLGLRGIDWLKLDTQGKDLDLFLSLDARQQSTAMAVDIEPGVIDFYHGENTMDHAHARMIQEGFWLAGSSMQLFPRVSKHTRTVLAGEGFDFMKLPGCPIAHEGTYLRTLASLAKSDHGLRDYASLWVIALANKQLGFALDAALAAERAFPGDDRAGLLRTHTVGLARAYFSGQVPPASLARRLVPKALHPVAERMRNLLHGGRT